MPDAVDLPHGRYHELSNDSGRVGMHDITPLTKEELAMRALESHGDSIGGTSNKHKSTPFSSNEPAATSATSPRLHDRDDRKHRSAASLRYVPLGERDDAGKRPHAMPYSGDGLLSGDLGRKNDPAVARERKEHAMKIASNPFILAIAVAIISMLALLIINPPFVWSAAANNKPAIGKCLLFGAFAGLALLAATFLLDTSFMKDNRVVSWFKRQQRKSSSRHENDSSSSYEKEERTGNSAEDNSGRRSGDDSEHHHSTNTGQSDTPNPIEGPSPNATVTETHHH